MVAAMFAQQLPGGLAIAPDPLGQYLIAWRCAPLQLSVKAFQTRRGETLPTGNTWSRAVFAHPVRLRGFYTSIFLRTSITAI